MCISFVTVRCFDHSHSITALDSSTTCNYDNSLVKTVSIRTVGRSCQPNQATKKNLATMHKWNLAISHKYNQHQYRRMGGNKNNGCSKYWSIIHLNCKFSSLISYLLSLILKFFFVLKFHDEIRLFFYNWLREKILVEFIQMRVFDSTRTCYRYQNLL